MLPFDISLIVFSAAALVGVEWGFAENRLFSDKPLNFDALILNHFKTYHAFMAVLFGTINTLAATAIFGALTTAGFLLWIWLMLWDTLILDVTWWAIRFLDFRLRPNYALKLYYPEVNAWHEQADWDNWLGLPLFNGCYWWWTAFTLLLFFVGLSVVIA